MFGRGEVECQAIPLGEKEGSKDMMMMMMMRKIYNKDDMNNGRKSLKQNEWQPINGRVKERM